MVALLIQSGLLALMAFMLGGWLGYALRQLARPGSVKPVRAAETVGPSANRTVGRIAGSTAAGAPVSRRRQIPVPPGHAPETGFDEKPNVAPAAAGPQTLDDGGGGDADADRVHGIGDGVPVSRTDGGSGQLPPPDKSDAGSGETIGPLRPSSGDTVTGPAPADDQPSAVSTVESEPVTAFEETFDDDQPVGLEMPRGGIADELRRVRGIGAKTEEALNAIGIWHYDQIAAWTDAETTWVAAYLGFPGRVAREDWTGQAGILAAGVDTEYSRAYDRRNAPAPSPPHAGRQPDPEDREGQ